MVNRIRCVLCLSLMLASLSYAENSYIVTGIIQNIEFRVITIADTKYYPVAEDIALEEFKPGDTVTIRYGQNKKGIRYYSQIVRVGETLSPLEPVPPA